MSISNQTTATNPATKKITFKGGQFTYWDGENNVSIPLPFKFTVMDTLACISGYDEASNSGIWSNEVHSTKTEPLTARSKGGEIASGIYSEIKDTIKAKGGRYCTSLYALHNGEIVNIKLTGAALSSWIGKDFKAVGVEVSELEDGKKGATTYKIPIFKEVQATDLDLAKEKDVELQDYFNKEAIEAKVEDTPAEAVEKPEDQSFGGTRTEDLPF